MINKYTQIVEKLNGSYPLRSSEARLVGIEARIGHILPSDYREFLQDFGGVTFRDAIFPMYQEDRWENARLFMFYGSQEEHTIADNYLRRIERYETPEEEDEPEDFEWYPGIHLVRDDPSPVKNMPWPAELLPIGCDPGGNEICLALFGSRPRAIFWWRDNPFEGSQNLYLVANSFDEFMHLLRAGE